MTLRPISPHHPRGDRGGTFVSVALRPMATSDGYHCMWVCLSAPLTMAAGWESGTHIAADYTTATRSIALRVSAERTENTRYCSVRNNGARVRFHTRQGALRHHAQRVPFQLLETTLTLSLPAWASAVFAHLVNERDVVRDAFLPKSARDVIQEDEREAIGMLEHGRTPQVVMEYFGWTQERVEGLQVRLRKELQIRRRWSQPLLKKEPAE